MGYQEFTIEGRNAVIEAYRAGKPIDSCLFWMAVRMAP